MYISLVNHSVYIRPCLLVLRPDDQCDLGSKVDDLPQSTDESHSGSAVQLSFVLPQSLPSLHSPFTGVEALCIQRGGAGLYREMRNFCSVQDPRDLGIRDLEANCCLFPLLNPAQRIYEDGSACGKSRYLALHEMGYMHNRRYLV